MSMNIECLLRSTFTCFMSAYSVLVSVWGQTLAASVWGGAGADARRRHAVRAPYFKSLLLIPSVLWTVGGISRF